jgi:D-glycero-beta-D-manno-heptose 1-phosphate adenylyltransferase
MRFADKVLPRERLSEWAAAIHARRQKLVVTNGCFDILHLGHATYLEAARNQGDVLLVGVNSDESVRAIKGPGRPINTEADRAALLAALASADAVTIFYERDALRLLSLVKPDVYVKGGDYTLETIHQPERRLVEEMGGKVVVIGGVPGKSTSGLVEKIADL